MDVVYGAVPHSTPRGRIGFGAVLALSMGVGPLATYGISALGPLVTEGLGLSRIGLGSIATVTFLAGASASVLVGRAVDAFSARIVMAALFIGAGGTLLAVAAAPSYAWLLVAVAVSGCFQALSNPVTNQLISANVPEGRRGVLMGVKQSGVQMSQFGAGLALPGLALVLGGWRAAVAASSVLAVVGLVLVRTSVPPSAPEPRGPGRGRAGRRLPRAVWWLCGYGFLIGAALQATNVYLPLFGYERLGMTVTTAGLSAAVVGGVGLVARMYWGRVADRMRRPHFLLALLAAVSAGAALCLTVTALTGTAWTMWLSAVLFGASGIAANVVTMVALVRVSELRVVGTASGVLTLGQFLGFAAGPVCFGAAVDRGGAYTAGWAAVAAVFAVAAALALLWRRWDGPLPEAGQTGAS